MPNLARLLMTILFPCALVALLPRARAGDGGPVSRPGVLHLDLEAAIRMALAKNFTIQVSEFDPKIARQDIRKALGSSTRCWSSARRALTSARHDTLVGNTRTDFTDITRTDVPIDATMHGNTVLGSQYRFGWNSTNTLANENLGFGNVVSGPSVSLTQPLLNGFGPTATLTASASPGPMCRSPSGGCGSRSSIRSPSSSMSITSSTLPWRTCGVAKSSRELARQLYVDNSRRAAIGVMSPLDITTARAEVAAREEGVILAERNMLDNENLLKQLVTNDLEPMLGVRVEIEPPPRRRPRS